MQERTFFTFLLPALFASVHFWSSRRCFLATQGAEYLEKAGVEVGISPEVGGNKLAQGKFQRATASRNAALGFNVVYEPIAPTGRLKLSRKFAIEDVIEEAKTENMKWLKKQGSGLADFHWQTGYGIFSVSESNVPQVKAYIANQEQHHHRMSFQEEFGGLCQRHGIEIDERYVWE